ncbi:PP2C family protein-serine/threonine phosphatase [Stutzerimonas nitrititolerans]|uniref:PP2C family protein-serine/threonine phosphatase n=1 Tax=Stutzerimonas nitrititolerans TaxID=2482751 RepID=UPI0028A95401|nr:protein phosphatase 2C domain-containing protein [Stutzerimonas nitrititolerans]
MITYEFTDKGPRVENQDSCYLNCDDGGIVAAVADGVGGNNGGAVASRIAIEILIDGYKSDSTLSECLLRAHEKILDCSSRDDSLRGMATTLTAAIFKKGVLKGVHCGDSRAYILRGNGIKQLTKDHTEVAKLLAEGRLTKDAAINYPRKNILDSALGTHKELRFQEFEFQLEIGDRVILATDGIYGDLTKKELVFISKSESDFNKFCEAVISRVVEIGPSDNYTLVGFEL